MVRKRNPLLVLILIIITFGVYGLVWIVKTKNEMNELGAKILTAWFIIIPILQIYWFWRYCESFSNVTQKIDAVVLFLIAIIFYPAFVWIVQSGLNEKV
ncbi:MAG: DUF4234 domain-containing protein [Candidatus Heimdallarchaeota archaeon]|nr:DUF4234 domain-containing protein [Candidatus Heimdallarchaeota archaeon]MCK4972671.1 DUF4234 domain-containing protein [Candidatus Heimdallarchaeota archaeon]